MLFRQVTHDDLGCASYLVGDDDAGVRIEHILETHNHADHVSGHGRLASAAGAAIHIHREASPDYDHEPFDDGWELELGSLLIRAIHTPGHRPEHTAFALVDRKRGPEPWAVLTGDTLFVNDVARPDLAIDKTDGLAGGMTSWRAEHRQVGAIERLRASDLPARRVQDPSLQVLDVRELEEWEGGHIPRFGAHSVPRPARASRRHRSRSARRRDLLVRPAQRRRGDLLPSLGLAQVIHVTDGGVGTWAREGHPIER